jgi:PAS domain S-box-containing protein
MDGNPSEGSRNGVLTESLGLPVLRILHSTAQFTGDRFFEAICERVAEACGAKMVYISEVLYTDRGRVLVAWRDGERIESFEYPLPDTPCAEAISRGSTIVRDGLARKFRLTEWLPGIDSEAFVGTLLRASSGDGIGIFGVVNDASMPDPDSIASLLEALAPRIASELERSQRESMLRRSEIRLNRVVDYCHDILFYYQFKERKFEFISPSVEAITGYPPEAFYANPELSIQIIYDQDRPSVRAAIESGSEEPILARIRTLEGDTRWIEYQNYAFHDEDGVIAGICGTIRDSTKRVQAQEALQISEHYRSALLSAIPDTIFRLDSEGTILDYISGDSTRHFGDAAKDLTGRNVKDLLPGDFLAPMMRLTHSALQSNHLQRAEFEVADGSQAATYEARAVPFGRKEVLVILRDFTAIKWHEGEEERHRFRDELDDKVERRRANPYLLTYRELAVLHLVADGQADKQIAESLGISTYTVSKHVGNILGKMNASSRTEAGVRSLREGLVG